MENVVLVTSMWAQVTIRRGMAQEDQLCSKIFKPAIAWGAKPLRYEDTPESARKILRTILDKKPVVLKIRQELANQRREFGETGFGMELMHTEAEKELSREMGERMSGHSIKMGELMEKQSKEIKQLERSMLKAMGELHQKLDEEKKKLQEEVEGLKVFVAELESERRNGKAGGWESAVRQTCEGLDRSSTDFGDKLNEILHKEEYEEWVSTLKNDLMWFINYLDRVSRLCIPPLILLKSAQALEKLDPSAPASRKCMRELKTICRTHLILPTSYTISPNLTVDPDAFASGGYARVHEGTLDGAKVCVKRLQVPHRNALLESTRVRY